MFPCGQGMIHRRSCNSWRWRKAIGGFVMICWLFSSLGSFQVWFSTQVETSIFAMSPLREYCDACSLWVQKDLYKSSHKLECHHLQLIRKLMNVDETWSLNFTAQSFRPEKIKRIGDEPTFSGGSSVSHIFIYVSHSSSFCVRCLKCIFGGILILHFDTVPRWFSQIYQNDHQRCGALCCHTEKEPPRSLEVVGNKKQMTYPIIPKNSKKKYKYQAIYNYEY